MSENYDVFVIFRIFDQFGAVRTQSVQKLSFQ